MIERFKTADSRTHWIGLFFVVLLGFALRIYGPGGSLWFDEVMTVYLASEDFSQILGYHGHTNPPLYFLILHAWMFFFGSSEFVLHLLPIFFGTAAILLTGVIGARIFDRQTGIVSALLVAITVFSIHFSREGRNYSLFLFLALVSLYYFLRLLERFNPWDALGYCLSTVALFYAHNYAVFTVVAENIYFFIYHRSSPRLLRKWILVQCLVIVFSLPWLTTLFVKTQRIMSGTFWIPPMGIAELPNTILVYSAFLLPRLIVLPYLVLLFLGAAEPWLKKSRYTEPGREVHKNVLLLTWMLCPILIPWFLSQFMTPFYFIRFTIAAAPACYILLARGMLQFKIKWLRRGSILMIVLVSLLSLANYYNVSDWNKSPWKSGYYLYPKENWRRFLATFLRSYEAGDGLSVYPGYYTMVLEHYGSPECTRLPLIKQEKSCDLAIKKVEEFTKGKRRHWIIFVRERQENEKNVLTALERQYEIRKMHFDERPTASTDVFLLSRRKAESLLSSRSEISFDDSEILFLNFHAVETGFRWTKNESDISNFRYITKGKKTLLILTSAEWHPYADEELQINITVNDEVPAQLVNRQNDRFFFEIENSRVPEITCVRIRSKTFVPADLKMNRDQRKLGVVFRNLSLSAVE